jgi:hypothetical protein
MAPRPPSPPTFSCPKCAGDIVYDEALIGRHVSCPHCQTFVPVPTLEDVYADCVPRLQETLRRVKKALAFLVLKKLLFWISLIVFCTCAVGGGIYLIRVPDRGPSGIIRFFSVLAGLFLVIGGLWKTFTYARRHFGNIEEQSRKRFCIQERIRFFEDRIKAKTEYSSRIGMVGGETTLEKVDSIEIRREKALQRMAEDEMCPSCRKFDARSLVSREVIDTLKGFRTASHEVIHTDPSGWNVTGRSIHYSDHPYYIHIYRCHNVCKFCGHKWHSQF